ncbi:MAG: tyrosine-protein phosphatase [Bacteroidales bacterium]|jgi:protein-tyrosine phosphatase
MIFSTKLLDFNYDIHSHLLPNVDDGCKTIEETINILRFMQNKGVTDMYFTPHINLDIYNNKEEDLKQKFEQLKENLPTDININLHLAAEYMVDSGFEDRIKEGNLLCFNNNYVLIEMSYYYPSQNIKEAIFQLNLNGYIPILAHPERYIYYSNNINELYDIKSMQCVFQLNLLSLFGVYGKKSICIIDKLIKNDKYKFIGSDCHSINQLEKIFSLKFPKKYKNYVSQLMENNQKLF